MRIFALSRIVELARETLGGLAGQTGKAILARSPSGHQTFCSCLMRGPCSRSRGRSLMQSVARLESGTPPLEVVSAVARELKQAMDSGEFDRWLDRPKSLTGNSKRTLVRCDNYLPGRRWKLQIFYIPEGHSHPPHSHDDVASCLVLVRGRLEAREFNRLRRLENGGDTIMLEKASEAVLGPGDTLLTDDEYHNVHWFGAVGGPAVAFNFQVVGCQRGKRPSDELRSYVDPVGGSGSDPFPAGRLGKAEAHAKYATRPLSAFGVSL